MTDAVVERIARTIPRHNRRGETSLSEHFRIARVIYPNDRELAHRSRLLEARSVAAHTGRAEAERTLSILWDSSGPRAGRAGGGKLGPASECQPA